MTTFNFNAIRLRLASPEKIISWSHGEVLKPETVNYRTQKPEKDGLFCERIFGPTKDYQCYCGKYKRIRYKGITCDKCGVEVTRASVRRERMGHIKLAVPVTHIWFLRGVPSRIGLLLNLSVENLEKIVYFASYIITRVDKEARKDALEQIEKEYKLKVKSQSSSRTQSKGKTKIKSEKDKVLKDLKTIRNRARQELFNLHKLQIISEVEYHNLSLKYGQVFEAGIGAETIRELLAQINLKEEIKKQGKILKFHETPPQKGTGQADIKAVPLLRKSASASARELKRLRLLQGMFRAGIGPEWMCLTILPVIPPDLRPLVSLDGGRFATSDLNDLYRRIINRNNRLKRLIELKAPEVIKRNEKRMLQEAVDALIDNGARRGQAVKASTGQKRLLKSLADMLKGKQGRFRQNLLGKRVDYSARSVIVIGPGLKPNQCGLPKEIALELFRPFIINKLVEGELASNVRSAGRLIEEREPVIWDILEEIISNRLVLLNRAPTLHRLGIQAFRPVLVEGKAIQIHPLVCMAFNADFDGDQMAVHLPLSREAQKEASDIMLSTRNLLKPATGEPITFPTKDIVLGCYWMTKIEKGFSGEGKIFPNSEEAILAYQFRRVHLKAKIKVRINNPKSKIKNPKPTLIETCVGRVIFNQTLPKGLSFINKTMNQKRLKALIAEIIEQYGQEIATDTLDKVKTLGFKYVTYSGISWGIDDLHVPQGKTKLIKETETKVEVIKNQYEKGFLSESERKTKVIEAWEETREKVAKLVKSEFRENEPVFTMVDSGARGSWSIITQLMGMRGLMANPAGETIELPVKDSLKEGLGILEYFISTHGARKGLADTALRTSKAGYLTRRLVDVAQDIIVREEDCRDSEGIEIVRGDEEDLGISFATHVVGRGALEDVKIKEKTIVKAGEIISSHKARLIDESGIKNIMLRSVISCKTRRGVCQKCYGFDLGKNKLVEIGEAIGIVTAQAIGEPGTQLTMRTFHTGGVAGGGDITQGLPRVEEIFEARSPRGKAMISHVDGEVLDVVETKSQKVVKIIPNLEIPYLPAGRKNTKSKKPKHSKSSQKLKSAVKEYEIPRRATCWVKPGDKVHCGQQLCEGHVDLKELFRVAGKEVLTRYILKEIQLIYSSQGTGVSDKHIEIIIRKMLSYLRIKNSGDTNLIPGSIVDRAFFEEENDKVKKKAQGEMLILGITKASLSTESFLSAASFQQTARVLIDAAVMGKVDRLRGLKENVIIGKLMPAGTGYRRSH